MEPNLPTSDSRPKDISDPLPIGSRPEIVGGIFSPASETGEGLVKIGSKPTLSQTVDAESGKVDARPKAEATSRFQAGQKLGGAYVLKELLISTPDRQVWSASDEVLGKEVSLWLLPEVVRNTARAMESLRAEVKKARQLIHPNILRTYELVEDSDWAAISMDSLPGKPLSEVVADKQNVDTSEVQPWVQSLSQTLADAHRIQVVHGALTTEDVFKDSTGKITIANFGITKIIHDTLDRSAGDKVRAYLSPQQLDGNALTASDDIYGVGALAYELLAGVQPFVGADMVAQIRKATPALMTIRRSSQKKSGAPIPSTWEKAVAAALAKDAASRPASILALKDLFSTESAPLPAATSGVSPAISAAAATAAAPWLGSQKTDSAATASAQSPKDPETKTVPSSSPEQISQKAPNVPLRAPEPKKGPQRPLSQPMAEGEPEERNWVVSIGLAASVLLVGYGVYNRFFNQPGGEQQDIPESIENSSAIIADTGAQAAPAIAVLPVEPTSDKKPAAYSPEKSNVAQAPVPPANATTPAIAAAANPPPAPNIPPAPQVAIKKPETPAKTEPKAEPKVAVATPPAAKRPGALIDFSGDMAKPATAPAPAPAVAKQTEQPAEKPAPNPAEKAVAIAVQVKAPDAPKNVEPPQPPQPPQPVKPEVAATKPAPAPATPATPATPTADLLKEIAVPELPAISPDASLAEKSAAIESLKTSPLVTGVMLGEVKNLRTKAQEELAALKKTSEERRKQAAPVLDSIKKIALERTNAQAALAAAEIEAKKAQEAAAQKAKALELAREASKTIESSVTEKIAAGEKLQADLTQADEELKNRQLAIDQAQQAEAQLLAKKTQAQALLAKLEKETASARKIEEENRRKAEEAEKQKAAQRDDIMNRIKELQNMLNSMEQPGATPKPSDTKPVKPVKPAPSAKVEKAEIRVEQPAITEPALPSAGEARIATNLVPTPTEAAEKVIPEEATAVAPEPRQANKTLGKEFANSLSMKFVQIGDVHVCVWPTRIKDFDGFARATGLKNRQWRDPGFQQGPDHPVVFVSWLEADAFCKWLTHNERKAGLISNTQFYRLPTDIEWSRFAGLNSETGSTPEARDLGIQDVYPWGTQWPPPPGAGNYTGEETNSEVAIKGYNDGFAFTSPVGSFSPNKNGLYDVGGNVWQWVDDWWNDSKQERLLRGGSFYNGALKLSLLTSSRYHAREDSAADIFGFRIVLASAKAAPVKK